MLYPSESLARQPLQVEGCQEVATYAAGTLQATRLGWSAKESTQESVRRRAFRQRLGYSSGQ